MRRLEFPFFVLVELCTLSVITLYVTKEQVQFHLKLLIEVEGFSYQAFKLYGSKGNVLGVVFQLFIFKKFNSFLVLAHYCFAFAKDEFVLKHSNNTTKISKYLNNFVESSLVIIHCHTIVL